MKLGTLPVIEQVFESGAKDRVFDGLLLIGPLVIVAIAVFGRSAITAGIAAAYLGAFVLHVLQNGLADRS